MLACVGLYGLMAYAVARRTAEIGIRLALGARRDHIIWLVLRETLWLTLAGIAAGIPLALWATRYAKSVLFGISPADPLTITAAVAALLAVAALAGYLPARRALRVEPGVALRWEYRGGGRLHPGFRPPRHFRSRLTTNRQHGTTGHHEPVVPEGIYNGFRRI